MSELIELCQNLVKFPSYNNNLSGVLSFLRKELEKLGFCAEIIKFANAQGQEVENLYAKYGCGQPSLLFAGHVDVVPSGEITSWKHPPFDAVIDDDVLYARGISDMKGGVGCFINACQEFIQSNSFNGSISLVISGDEEEPIVNGTYQLMEYLTAQGESFDFCIVGEPSNPNQIGEEIKVGRRGDVVLRIKSIGQQGHTAYPSLAINPIHNLVKLLNNLQNDILDEGNDYFGPSTLQVTTIDVGNLASNVIPASASAQIDIRFNSNYDSKGIIAWIQKHIDNCEGKFGLESEVVGESFLSPISVSTELLKTCIEKISGISPKYSTSGGTSDARFIKNYCDVVEFGLTNASIHKINESAKVSDIKMVAEIYKEFLTNYFS